MSVQPSYEPVCSAPPRPESANVSDPAELVIRPRERDLGGFTVRRVLPAHERRMVGPFIFFDEMGPAVFPPGQGIDVRPHPHIGLATVTYLFEGEIMHRDSLGFVQPIRPGAVNLMTAGRGIVHSERAGADRAVRSRLHGIQSWMALPVELEETEPAFVHYPADRLPMRGVGRAKVTVVMGNAYGETSPVETLTPLVYVDAELPAGATLPLPDGIQERAFYVVAGQVTFGSATYDAGVMVVARAGTNAALEASADARVVIVGGEPFGPRHIEWNFVSSSQARIEQAKQAWRDGGFARIVGDDEFIPLP
jgi:hypothetical protein